jgi:hypothetical protein
MLGYIGTFCMGLALGATAVTFGPGAYADPVLGIILAWGAGVMLVAYQVFRNWQRRVLAVAPRARAHSVVQPVRTTDLTLRG